MKSATRLLLAAALLILPAAADGLRVSAAASLTEAIRETSAAYRKQTGTTITINLGGSQTLARQIEAGAPADVFISANQSTMDRLVANRRVRPDTVRPLLTNRLAVIVPAHSKLSPKSASDIARLPIRRLSLGDPDLVPAGIYAKAWLKRHGFWKQLQPKVVGMENVRGALAIVEAGNADIGIVYQTDALISRRVRVTHLVPTSEHPPIRYPAAVTTSSRHPEAAARFLAWLQSPAASAIFARHGFTPQQANPEPVATTGNPTPEPAPNSP